MLKFLHAGGGWRWWGCGSGDAGPGWWRSGDAVNFSYAIPIFQEPLDDPLAAARLVDSALKQRAEVRVMNLYQCQPFAHISTPQRSTNINEHSSRSHVIVTLSCTCHSRLGEGVSTRSQLHLVDLAGSESNKVGLKGVLHPRLLSYFLPSTAGQSERRRAARGQQHQQEPVGAGRRLQGAGPGQGPGQAPRALPQLQADVLVKGEGGGVGENERGLLTS